ncbi:hypothetical protein U2F10_03945 [Leptothoe sp. EHU-05/26/07-4]
MNFKKILTVAAVSLGATSIALSASKNVADAQVGYFKLTTMFLE